MEAEQEVVVKETIPENEGIEPFDWEGLLHESWLEEHLQKKKRKLAEAGA